MSRHQPVAYQGQNYPSISALRRATGYGTSRADRLLREGVIVRLDADTVPQPPRAPGGSRRPVVGSGQRAHRDRLLRAVEEIQAVAEREPDPLRPGQPVELLLRRRGLLKALWLYRQRYGQGVSDGPA